MKETFCLRSIAEKCCIACVNISLKNDLKSCIVVEEQHHFKLRLTRVISSLGQSLMPSTGITIKDFS